MNVAMQWFYMKDGKTKGGPVSGAALQALAKSGQLLPTHKVCKAGTEQWIVAGKVKGLFAKSELTDKPSSLPVAVLLDASPTAHTTPIDNDVDEDDGSDSGIARHGKSSKLVFIAGGIVLGLAITVTVAVSLVSAVDPTNVVSTDQASMEELCRTEAQNLADQLRRYHATNGSYPPPGDWSSLPRTEQPPRDGWNRVYRWDLRDSVMKDGTMVHAPSVWSCGPNGIDEKGDGDGIASR